MPTHRYTDDDAIKAIKECSSFMKVFQKLGLSATTGGNYATIRNIIAKYKLDISHFSGQGWAKGKENSNAVPLKEMLVKNSKYPTSRFKKRLIRSGLIELNCNICKRTNEWMEKLLVLQLDHKNGDKYDKRIENLRLLCPNCHSQTENYCGKKKKNMVFDDPNG